VQEQEIRVEIISNRSMMCIEALSLCQLVVL
jgi:hypothetical protein